MSNDPNIVKYTYPAEEPQKPYAVEVPKNDIIIERAVLSAVLSYGKNTYEAVAGIVSEDCFYDADNKMIWRFIRKTEDPSLTNVYETMVAENLTDEVKSKLYSSMVTAISSDDNGYRSNYVRAAEILVSLREQRQLQLVQWRIAKGEVSSGEDLLKEAKAIADNAQSGRDGRFMHLLTPPTHKQLIEKYKQVNNGWQTQYVLKKGNDKYHLEIPAAAVTFICAPTSHGKSTMLRNIALQWAEDTSTDGAILYFTFEESDTAVYSQLCNTYIGKRLRQDDQTPKKEFAEPFAQGQNGYYPNNIKALRRYLQGDAQYIKADRQYQIGVYREDFENTLICNGALRVNYVEYDCNELLEATNFLMRNIKVKAVFMDYVQLLYDDQEKTRQRTEEMKKICTKFKNFANRTKIPVVMAAQLNREVTNPFAMRAQKIAEASDIEKVADTIICLWNNAHKPEDLAKFEEERRAQNIWDLEDFFSTDEYGRVKEPAVYVFNPKNRGDIVGGSAVLRFDGNAGLILPNNDN